MLHRSFPAAQRRFLLCLLAALLLAGTAHAGLLTPEQQLHSAVDHLRSGRGDEGFTQLEKLVRREPNFRLAQLLYSELLAARSGVKGALPAGARDARVKDLMEEARLRFAPVVAPAGKRAAPVLRMAESQRHAILVDLPGARLYVLENTPGGPQVVREHYAAMGKNGYGKMSTGDLRTPIGVYAVTGFMADDQLPELYGSGSFPLDYPNLWDRRRGRTGSGIWLHGVPRDTYARAPRSSEGCVTMANEDLLALKSRVQPGTPVILSDRLEWLTPAQANAQREAIEKEISHWRAAWSALDTEGYLGFYAPDFRTADMDRAGFAAHKRRVNAGKRRINVQVSDLELIRYPGEDALIAARFVQDYDSDNFQVRSRKQQFWKRQADGRWRIVLEESR